MKNFIKYPEQVDIHHYENIREEVIKIFKDDNSVVSIYEYGSVSSPGVSDIDLIFVLSDTESKDEATLNLLNASHSAQHLVADGNVIKMPEQTMEQLLYIDNLFPKRLLGKEIFIHEPNEEESTFIKLVALMDWLPERVLKLGKIYTSQTINVTNALCTLHSLCYSLKSLNKILAPDPGSIAIVEKTADLRNNWYEFDKPEKNLVELLEDALDVGHKQIFNYSSYLRASDMFTTNGFESQMEVDLELYPGCFIRFINTNKSINYKESLKLSQDSMNFVIIPSYFLPHFYYQSIHDGLISKNIRSKFSKELNLDISSLNTIYLSTIKNKIEIIEENAKFLIRQNLNTGLLRFGFHFQ